MSRAHHASDSVRHSLQVAAAHLRVQLLNEFQYRANLVVQLLQSAVAALTGLVAINIVFRHAESLNGWTRPQLLVVMGVYMFLVGVIAFAVQPAMDRLMGDVQQGTFDYVLTKPVDSQVLVSVRDVQLWSLTNSVVGLAVLAWGVVTAGAGIGLGEWAAFVLTLAAGVVVIYCVWLIPTTLVFRLTRLREIHDLFTGFQRAGQYPTSVYPAWLRFGLTYILPVGAAVTVPAGALTGRLTLERLGITLGVVVAAIAFARWCWTTALRHYSGASA